MVRSLLLVKLPHTIIYLFQKNISALNISIPGVMSGFWNEDCSRAFHLSTLVFSTQQQSAISRFPSMEGLALLCDVLNYSQQLLQVNSTEPATAVTALVAEQVYRDACQWVSCIGFCYLSSILIMLCNIPPMH